MTSLTKDPLLAIAKGTLWVLMGAMALATAACVIAIPAVIVLQNRITIEVGKELPGLPGPEFIGALLVILLFVAILLAMLFRVFQLLKRIVDTVGEGDPFVPANASRLTQMAWLTLAGQFVALPIAGMALWIKSVTEGAAEKAGKAVDMHIEGGLDVNGLLLVLILFILARVFREGTRLRAEVEGTV